MYSGNMIVAQRTKEANSLIASNPNILTTSSRSYFRMFSLCKPLFDRGMDNPGTGVRARNAAAIPIIIGSSMVRCWTSNVRSHDAEVIGRTSLSWVSPFWAQNALFWAQNNPESTCACAHLVETGIEKRGSQNFVSRQKWIEFPSNIPPFSKATWYF